MTDIDEDVWNIVSVKCKFSIKEASFVICRYESTQNVFFHLSQLFIQLTLTQEAGLHNVHSIGYRDSIEKHDQSFFDEDLRRAKDEKGNIGGKARNNPSCVGPYPEFLNENRFLEKYISITVSGSVFAPENRIFTITYKFYNSIIHILFWKLRVWW